MAKKLPADSALNDADLDGDGIVSNEELSKHERMIQIENADKREDAQRNLAWFALFGMLLYPFAVVLAVLALSKKAYCVKAAWVFRGRTRESVVSVTNACSCPTP